MAAESCGVKPQLLIDLQGPELRTGAVAEPILLKNEEIVEICAAADWKTENERNDRCGDMESDSFSNGSERSEGC